MENRYFETRYTFNSGRKRVWRAITEHLQRYIPKESSVLELGAGYCDFINQIIANKKTALDFDESSEQYKGEDVRFVKGSVLDFVPMEKYDVVFASNFLEHFTIKENETILKTIYQSLPKKGKLILVQPNYYYCYRNYFDDYTHKTVFSHNNIIDFLRANKFRVNFVKRRFLPFSFKSHLPASYLLTKMYLKSPIKPFAKQMLIVAEKDV